MKQLQAGEIIDYSDGSFPVKARKLGLLKTARNSFIQGSYQLVDLVGGGLIWSGLNEDFGESIRKFSGEIQAKYDVPMLNKQFELEDLKNPEFYFANIPQMIPMLTALIPAAMAGGTGGAAVASAFKLGKWTSMGVTALSSALASRPIESAMEAVGTYNELIDQDVSKEKAGEAAAGVFTDNMTLIGMDAAQYALAFMKVHPAIRQSLGKWISSTGARAVGFAAASASEGWEEVIQGYFQELGRASAKGEADPDLVKALKLSSPEAKKEFVLGTMMGVGFQTAGAISGKDVLTDEDINRIIDEQIIISEVNDGGEPTDVKDQKIVDALNKGLKEAGLGLGLEEEKIEEPTKKPAAVEADIKAKPVIEEPPAVTEKKKETEPTEIVEPVVEKTEKVEESEAKLPDKATTENVDEFLGQELELGTLSKDDTGYFVQDIKTGEKSRIAPSQAVNYVNEAIKPKEAVKPKEAPIAPKEKETTAKPKLDGKETILEPELKADKQLFTEIYEDIEKQIDTQLKISNIKDLFDAGKDLTLNIKSGDNFTVVDNKIKIKTPEGEHEFAVPKNKAELKDLKPAILEAFKREKTIITPKRVATVEEIEKSRKKYNLADIPLDEARKWVDVFKRAEKRKPEALHIAKAIKRKARVLTNDEFATLALRKTEVEDLIDDTQAEIAKAVDNNNIAEQSRHAVIMDGALSDLDEITEALRFSNREAGRALNIIQVALKKEGEQYKLAKIIQIAKVAKGETLTREEISRFGELTKKIKTLKKKESTLTKEIETLQEKLSKQDAMRDFKRTTRTISRQRSQAVLKTEREDLFKSLDKIGYRLNDVIGLTYESATIISKLAINYFESGVKEIDAIVEKIQTKVPDLSKKNVYDSLGGRIKKTKKIVISNTKKEIADLKTQARLLGEIEDAYDGIFEQIKKSKNPSDKVFKLQSKLRDLKKEATKTVREDETLNKILLKIDTTQDQLIAGLRDIKKTKRTESPDIKNARQELSEIRRLIATKDKIADLENQLETGNFKVPVKIQRVVKSADLIETQVRLSQLRREVREHIHRMKKRTKRELFVDVITLPRTLMATADLSGVLRQAIFLSARHPIVASKVFMQSTKAFFSQNTADEIDVFIRKHENQPVREKAGLFLASLDNINFTTREEDFVSNLGEKIPAWGKVIKASNRNMASHLNLLRAYAFDHFLKLYPNATTEELHRWANYVNISSGRGDLGSFNKVANELSVAFFAPRFSMSRIQLPFQIFKNWKHPNVRKEIAKHTMAFISMTGTALFLATLAGFKVGTDPEDSDFLKIIIGDTRIDILGGLQQPMRVMILAILKVLDTAGAIKMKRDIDLYNAVARFVRYKFGPAISMPLELMQGKNAIGQEVDVLDTFTNNITPLALADIIDTYKSKPLLAAAIAPLAILGIGINTFEKKKRIKRSIKKKK